MLAIINNCPWSHMTSAELVAAIIEGTGEFAWVRGQLKVALTEPRKKRVCTCGKVEGALK